jgi:hypothetical protein
VTLGFVFIAAVFALVTLCLAAGAFVQFMRGRPVRGCFLASGSGFLLAATADLAQLFFGC